MRRPHTTRARGALIGIVAVALAASACSSSGSGKAGDTHAATSSGSASGSANLAAAKQAIAPYVGHPSVFPETATLAKRPAPGSEFDFLQCSAPVCAIFAQLLVAPAKALGVKLKIINSGASATTSQAAAATALSDKPAALLVGASNPQLYGDYLHKLISAGSVVVGGGVVGGEPYGVQESTGGGPSVSRIGALLADWVVAHKGPSANVVFYGTPELTFSQPMQTAFGKELSKRCPSCKDSFQQLSVTKFGTTAPSQVVSYLQSNPSANTVVFASMEGATGLAAALRNAHVSPTTLGFAPTPSNLQDIAQGGLTASLGLDLNTQVWSQVNIAARLIAHQPISAQSLESVLQFLTQSDLKGKDFSHGYTGYPDVAQRISKLWASAT